MIMKTTAIPLTPSLTIVCEANVVSFPKFKNALLIINYNAVLTYRKSQMSEGFLQPFIVFDKMLQIVNVTSLSTRIPFCYPEA